MADLKGQLTQFLTEKGEFQPEVKEQVVKEYCETSDGECWFFRLAMPMLVATVIELVESTHNANLDVVFPKVVKSYYKEGATCPWNRRKRLEAEKLATKYVKSSKNKEIQVTEQENPVVSAENQEIEDRNPNSQEYDG